MSQIRYAVWKAARGFPEGYLPRGWVNRWDSHPGQAIIRMSWSPGDHGAPIAAKATGRFEQRCSDGVLAEIYEFDWL